MNSNKNEHNESCCVCDVPLPQDPRRYGGGRRCHLSRSSFRYSRASPSHKQLNVATDRRRTGLAPQVQCWPLLESEREKDRELDSNGDNAPCQGNPYSRTMDHDERREREEKGEGLRGRKIISKVVTIYVFLSPG